MRWPYLIILAVLFWPVIALSEPLSLSSKSRSDLLKSQLNFLDDRSAAQYSTSVGLEPPRAFVPGTPAALAMMGETETPYLKPAISAAQAFDIPEDLFLRLIKQESGWNPAARSPKGAIGLAQLMPGTARLLQVNASSPTENLNGGARYLRMMYDRFGSWRLALAAYNAGPEAVVKYKGIPPYPETRNYVQNILPSR